MAVRTFAAAALLFGVVWGDPAFRQRADPPFGHIRATALIRRQTLFKNAEVAVLGCEGLADISKGGRLCTMGLPPPFARKSPKAADAPPIVHFFCICGFYSTARSHMRRIHLSRSGDRQVAYIYALLLGRHT